ncbi:hypothetical protein ACLMAL_01715 [Nocardia sp. CWNU-33]|uniref:hypothetical protein n=1 Tax=Nocardia sp. CWNU-33 TaxID=3392117 RepID=UPI00398EFCBC
MLVAWRQIVVHNSDEITMSSTTAVRRGAAAARRAIEYPCDGSKFSIADGSVLRGLVREPLAARTVAIEATEIVVR